MQSTASHSRLVGNLEPFAAVGVEAAGDCIQVTTAGKRSRSRFALYTGHGHRRHGLWSQPRARCLVQRPHLVPRPAAPRHVAGTLRRRGGGAQKAGHAPKLSTLVVVMMCSPPPGLVLEWTRTRLHLPLLRSAQSLSTASPDYCRCAEQAVHCQIRLGRSKLLLLA